MKLDFLEDTLERHKLKKTSKSAGKMTLQQVSINDNDNNNDNGDDNNNNNDNRGYFRN